MAAEGGRKPTVASEVGQLSPGRHNQQQQQGEVDRWTEERDCFYDLDIRGGDMCGSGLQRVSAGRQLVAAQSAGVELGRDRHYVWLGPRWHERGAVE